MFLSYRDNPPYTGEGKTKTMIPWPEWRDSILEEKPKETDDGFEVGDGIKTAERILKKFDKKKVRQATPEEIKKIKARDERRAKRRKNK